jgi:hypothetical protein
MQWSGVKFEGRKVPEGRLNLAQDASPGLGLKGRQVPQGRLKYAAVQSWTSFSRPFGT